MNDENSISPKESDIQSAIIEIASKRIIEFTNNNMLLEANLLVCQNNLKTQIKATQDLETEVNTFRTKSDKSVESKNKKLNESEEKLAEVTSRYEVVVQERNDLTNKIESGYKKQIRELQNKITELEK